MREALKNPESPEAAAKVSWTTFLLAGLVLAAIVVSFWLFFKTRPGEKSGTLQTTRSAMAPVELEYAKNIRVENVTLSRAENFLHQEVTTLTADLINGGSQPVVALGFTIEFADELNQIVLRETRNVVGAPAPKLGPGEKRSFEISFDHIPSSWNMQLPNVRIAYLHLAR